MHPVFTHLSAVCTQRLQRLVRSLLAEARDAACGMLPERTGTERGMAWEIGSCPRCAEATVIYGPGGLEIYLDVVRPDDVEFTPVAHPGDPGTTLLSYALDDYTILDVRREVLDEGGRSFVLYCGDYVSWQIPEAFAVRLLS